MALKTFNTRDLLNDPKIKEPWPEQFVDWYVQRDPKLTDELATVLNEAKDERPLQEFYTKHPSMLALVFPVHCCWVFPKPRLGGGKWVPDFLLCDKNSLGFRWILIELESPTMEATNKDGSVSADCNHALQQIRDYRRWLRDNALFEEKQGFKGLNADCEGWIVIGRRDTGRTDLEQQLKSRGIDTVVLTGISTNAGVESTARQGTGLGFAFVLVEDACSAQSAEHHRFAFENIFPRLTRVRATDEVLAALA